MANNNINISIGSSFNAEGFNKLAQSASDVTKTVGKVTGAVGQIGGAIGGLDGTVGKVTGAVSNLFQSFAMGGPIGVAIAGVTALVGWFQKMKTEAEESRKKLEAMAQAAEKAKIEKAFKEAQVAVANANTALDEHIKRLNDATAASERLAKAEKQVADAQAKLERAGGNYETAQLKQDIQERVNRMSWDKELAAIEAAKGNVELVQLQAKQIIQAMDDEYRAIRQQILEAQEKMGNLQRASMQAEGDLDDLQVTLARAVQTQKAELDKLKDAENAASRQYTYLAGTVGETDKETVAAYQKLKDAHDAVVAAEERVAATEKAAAEKIEAAKKKVTDINLQLAETTAREQAASKDLEAADIKCKTARTEAATAEAEAVQNLKELEDATAKERKARLDAAEAEKRAQQLKAEAASKIRDAEIEAAKNIKLVDADMAKLQQAIKNAEQAMQAAATGVAWANQNNWGGWGNQEFNPDNFEDWRKANRFNERNNRDANSRRPGENRKAGWEKREAELARRLGFGKDDWDNLSDEEFEKAMNSKAARGLSNAEKQWLRDKRNWDAQQNKDKNQKNLEKLQKERNKILEKMKTDVAKIKDDLKEALTVK